MKILKEEAHGIEVRSRYQQNAGEETASLYHQAREVKMLLKLNLNKLKIRTVEADGTEILRVSEDREEIVKEYA